MARLRITIWNWAEISSYPPGYKEECRHLLLYNNPWVSCAETVVGHGDRAFEIYKKTCPAYIEDISEIHRTEPYVYSQMVAAVMPRPHFGGRRTAADRHRRLDVCGCEPVHPGHQLTLAGLKIDPLHPHEMDGFTAVSGAGATYEIMWRTLTMLKKALKR